MDGKRTNAHPLTGIPQEGSSSLAKLLQPFQTPYYTPKATQRQTTKIILFQCWIATGESPLTSFMTHSIKEAYRH